VLRRAAHLERRAHPGAAGRHQGRSAHRQGERAGAVLQGVGPRELAARCVKTHRSLTTVLVAPQTALPLAPPTTASSPPPPAPWLSTPRRQPLQVGARARWVVASSPANAQTPV